MPTRLVVLHDWFGEWCCAIRAGVGGFVAADGVLVLGELCIAPGEFSGLGLRMLTSVAGQH